jgi:hypothetical protein
VTCPPPLVRQPDNRCYPLLLAGPGRGPATNGRLVAAFQRRLAAGMAPAGQACRLGRLVRRGGITFRLTVPWAGRVDVRWLAKPASRRPVVVANGRRSFPTASAGRVRVALTPRGRRLLKRAQVKLVARGTFESLDRPAIQVSRGFKLRR